MIIKKQKTLLFNILKKKHFDNSIHTQSELQILVFFYDQLKAESFLMKYLGIFSLFLLEYSLLLFFYRFIALMLITVM